MKVFWVTLTPLVPDYAESVSINAERIDNMRPNASGGTIIIQGSTVIAVKENVEAILRATEAAGAISVKLRETGATIHETRAEAASDDAAVTPGWGACIVDQVASSQATA